MSYKHILYAVLLFLFGQTITWIQINGSILWPWAKQYKIIFLLLGIPVSWVFMEATAIAVNGFGGEFWPSRIISFASGIFVFSILTYVFKSEAITLKTAISLILALSIVLIQLFWK